MTKASSALQITNQVINILSDKIVVGLFLGSICKSKYKRNRPLLLLISCTVAIIYTIFIKYLHSNSNINKKYAY